jgi:protein SCO1/2
MNKIFKTGILVLVLVLPVFFYMFLRTYGNNNYKLNVITPESYDAATGEVYKIERVPDFKLQTQDGSYLTRQDLDGKIYVANFIFTRCKGICPKMTTQMSRVQEYVKDMEDVRLVSHTVDPEHDSSAVLNDYASMYGAIPGKWYFLTGTKEELYKLAYRGYSLPAMKDDGGPEEFLHSEKFILIDSQGRMRGIYDGTDPEDVDRLLLEINILRQES